MITVRARHAQLASEKGLLNACVFDRLHESRDRRILTLECRHTRRDLILTCDRFEDDGVNLSFGVQDPGHHWLDAELLEAVRPIIQFVVLLVDNLLLMLYLVLDRSVEVVVVSAILLIDLTQCAHVHLLLDVIFFLFFANRRIEHGTPTRSNCTAKVDEPRLL